MAAPKLVKLIGVKVTSSSVGEYVIVRNLTQGGQLTQRVAGTDRSTVFNPVDSDLEWVQGDLVQAEVRGRITGAKQATLNAMGTTITIPASTDTSTDGVTL